MNWQDIYSYCKHDLTEHPCHYHYTTYHGPVFLQSWRAGRMDVLSRLDTVKPDQECDSEVSQDVGAGEIKTADLLEQLYVKLKSGEVNDADFEILKILVQKFEVSKKVYSAYTKKFMRGANAVSSDLKNYVMLAQVFALAYEQAGKLYYLNVLLKLIDTLTSAYSRMPSELYEDFTELVKCEEIFIKEIADKHGVAL